MEYFLDYMKVIGFLCLILFLFYILAKYLKNNVEGLKRSKYIEVLDSVAVSQKGSLQVARVGDKTYLLGVTDHTINILDKVDETKLEEYSFEKKDFRSLFSKTMGKEDHIEKD